MRVFAALVAALGLAVPAAVADSEPSQPPVYFRSSGTPTLMAQQVVGGDMVFIYLWRGGFYRASRQAP